VTQPQPAKVPKSFVVAVPTSDARSRTQEVLDANRYQAERLYASRDAQRRLVRMLRDADTQLARKLATLLPNADGSRTWTQQDTEATLALVRMQLAEVQAKLARQLEANGVAAREMGARETTQILEMFEGLNPGSIRPLSIRAAHQLALGTVSAQYQTSVARYGMQAITSIQRDLTAGVLVGRTFDEMTQRLQRSEPLLSRRWMAERMVRTECMSAYNEGHLDEMHAQREVAFPDLMKRAIETFDRRTAQDSYAVHGQTKKLEEMFVDGKGRHYLRPPGRPNDRGICIPFRLAWEESPATRQRTRVADAAPVQSEEQAPIAAKAQQPAQSVIPAALATLPTLDTAALVKRGVSLGVESPALVSSTWGRVFAGRVPTPDAIEAMYSAPKAGIEAKLRMMTVNVSGQPQVIFDLTKKGRVVGEGVRRFERDAAGQLVVHHDWLMLNERARGKGAGAEISERSLAAYRAMGAREIQLTAGSIGRYTWAKLGYEWSEKAAATKREELTAYLTRRFGAAHATAIVSTTGTDALSVASLSRYLIKSAG
jgi:GNAT superfamily N-acetyltransferase